MQAARPTLEIVIVTAPGCRAYLAACLQSLRAAPLTLGDQRVTVVDNASDDGSEAIVRGFGDVSWRAMGRNAGFSTANNLALRDAAAEYILLLNPDTEVAPGTLDACLARMRSSPAIGVLGCRLLDPAGTPDPNAKRTLPTRAGALRRLSFADRLLGPSSYHTPELGFRDNGPVGAVSGAFMMIRRAALAGIGLLDEGFWMYGEDLDFCARAGAAGWVVWYEGAAVTLHVKGGSAGRVRRARPTVAFHLSMGRYYRRHLDRRSRLDLAVYGGILARLCLALVVSASAGGLRRLGVRRGREPGDHHL
jgi:N-acetylglucosaminyl-diphospho-decaprenol L-rhamnosyltransferase